jgi:exodeoxyribonuclease VII large subunit
MTQQLQIFTLKQVVSSIRKTIEERYHQTYWVKAEMHKLNRAASGHCFPELLQKENGKIVAEMRASIWKHNYENINNRFIKIAKEPLKEDTTLLLQVKIGFHEIYGLSLQILDIDPNYVLGELQKERQETLLRLKNEGLINLNQQLSFPLLPKRVAIISAEGSKGLSDFMQVLEANPWKYSFFTYLFPASLQGDNATESITAQLQRIEKVKEHFDVVVIVRGGGGEVGLSCYNNYLLCKSIASFPLPVLTGIGHSTNLTVSEMVSFRNAITPTELADFLIQSFHNFSVPLKEALTTIAHETKVTLELVKKNLINISHTFKYSTNSRIEGNKSILQLKAAELKSNSTLNLRRHQELLKETSNEITNGYRIHRERELSNLQFMMSSLPQLSRSQIELHGSAIDGLQKRVQNLHPENVLKRGYSITTINDKSIGPNNDVNKGDVVTTRTATFIIESEITSKEDLYE